MVPLDLSRLIPIVSLKWLDKLVDAVINFKPIPSTESHLPVLAKECKVNDVALFLPDKRRAKLFEGEHFYLLNNDEYQFYSLPIAHCSGKSTLVDISDATYATFDKYVKKNSILISGKTPALSGFLRLINLSRTCKIVWYKLVDPGYSLIAFNALLLTFQI